MPRSVHGPPSMPCICSSRPPPADGGEDEEQRDEPEPRARGRERRREAAACRAPGRVPRRSSAQAAQENSDVESPVLPSYSMPNALMLRALRLGHRELGPDRVEHAVEPDRLARLDRRTGRCPRSRSRSRRRCGRCGRRPSSTTSIGARSTPSISPTSGARPAIGPPSWPPKTPSSFCDLLVASPARRRTCRAASCPRS